jgi:hypothetical protein
MAKTFDELMEMYGHNKIGEADLALGRDNPGALEQILQERQNWANATTQAERDAAHNKAENIRKAYGQYSGGAKGMDGQYSPTYVKPSPAAQNDNVTALYEKYNNLYGKQNAPTWTPQYQEQINELLGNITNRDAFSYNMNEDPLYQQYRDQYVREGQKAMRDSAAQTAALTGGYGSTYGAIAAQQGYDNYLAQLNDRVPQLEQQAYGKYVDNLADMYNQLGAYQSEENRLYGQYLDSLNQFNTDRDYAFNSMQAAMNQNNYENEFNRGIFETDRAFNQDFRQQDISNAASFGDWDKVEGYDYDVDFMKQKQALDELQMAFQTGQLGAKMAGATGGSSGGSGGNNNSGNNNNDNEKDDDGWKVKSAPTQGYLLLKNLYRTYGNTPAFEKLVDAQIAAGNVTEDEYNRFESER